ncbi:VanZ family protein [Leucobacter chromiireducens]|uniref:VanZ family protein n=1 Tax=Leucobacter chromiireducens TaxID=283877 RepID=UPI003F7F9CCB
MLATFLVEYPWLVPAAFLAFALASPFLGAWLVERRSLLVTLFALAIVATLALVFTPTGRTLAVGCLVEWSVPVPRAVEPFANVVLFVPIAFLGALFIRRPLTVALLGSLASALIETAQAILPALGRSCSTNDWLANSIGALIGALLAWGALALRRRWDRAHLPTAAVNS